ncbi:hypothetical protein ACHWQZ_G017365 [Mnemiopsis leidyi]
MALSVDTTPAKHVTVLRNGDGKYEGRKFVVSRRRYRTFDALLSDITHQISAPFGAVRRLYTPKGSRQIRGIDDLEGGATYVAGGSERFKKINYNPQQPGKNWGFTSNVKPGFLADDPPPLILPKKNKKYAQRSAQFHKVRQPVQFTVYRNGLGSDKGTKFLLKAREMKSFETVLSIISFKIRLVEGAVRRLFTLEGALLHGPEDIVDGGQYVACGHRRFILASYGESNQPARTQKLPSIKRRKDPNQASPRTQSNPLPAIQKKTAETKARSEKDSPAPIEEDKGNDEVMVIVSRGSQADLVEDDPDQIASENGHLSPDEPACNANASDALAINSPEDEAVSNGKEDTAEIITSPHQKTGPTTHSPVAKGENLEEDISRTEVTTVSPKSRSRIPIAKKSNQAVSSEAESDADLYPESQNGERTISQLSFFGCSSAEITEQFNESPCLDFEDGVNSEGEENLDDKSEEGENDSNSETEDEENMDDRTECEKEYPKDKTEDDKDHNDSETEDEDEYIDGRIEDGKEDRDCEPKYGEEKDIDDKREDELEEPVSEEEVASLYSSALCDETDEEDFLEEEIKSLPSKSKLDRNPPKKKSNPELLANGSDDSVFNATAAKTNNQDGQFLMNNVEEGETNGHEDGDEIEEDGELVEDKPIDLQQAEEIPEDDTNVPKRPNRESRSQSSNK